MISQKIINLFIIEDNVLYAKALKQYLLTGFAKSDYAISIQIFKDSESCLEWLNFYNNAKPNIIILDYFLNDHFSQAMNGLNALFQLKLCNAEVEVIFLSSQKDMEVTVESLRTGAFDYIVKDEHAFPKVLNSITECLREIEKAGKLNPGYKRKTVSL